MHSDLVPVLSAIGAAVVLPLLALGSAGTQTVAILVPMRDGLPESARLVAEAGGEILGIAGGHLLQARSDRPGFSARLYAAGAWLVLPSFGAGCEGRASAAGPRTIRQTTIQPSTAGP